ncbi:hypothetical protein ACWGCP_29990 [Streptomyces niveus]
MAAALRAPCWGRDEHPGPKGSVAVGLAVVLAAATAIATAVLRTVI